MNIQMYSPLIAIFGLSGTGKTTLANNLCKKGFQLLITSTSRSPREGEKHGVDYFFSTLDGADTCDYIYKEKFGDHYYGISRDAYHKLDLSKPTVTVLYPTPFFNWTKYFSSLFAINLIASKKTLNRRLQTSPNRIKRHARECHHTSLNWYKHECVSQILINTDELSKTELEIATL